MNIRREIGEALGDAAREGIERLAKSVDDWGWRGGKKGEITGGRLMEMLRTAWRTNEARPGEWGSGAAQKDFIQAYQKFYDQITKKPASAIAREAERRAGEFGRQAAAVDAAAIFERLETAGIPRQWTGRVLETLKRSNMSDQRIAQYAGKISDVMRPLTNEQRETFLNLVERDTTGRPFEALAETAKKLYRRKS